MFYVAHKGCRYLPTFFPLAYKEIMKSEQTGEVLLPPSAFLISNPNHFNCPQDVSNDAERTNSAISNKSTRKLSISSIISK